MKVTPKDEVDSERALYGNDDSEDFGAQIRSSQKKSREKSSNDDDCKVVHESELKKGGLKFTPTKSKNNGYFSDDIVVRTTADMSPYCVRLINEAAASLDTSFETAFVHISSSIRNQVFDDLRPLYDNIKEFLLPAFKMNIEDEDGDLGLVHTHIFKRYDEREPEKVSLLLHSSTYTRIKAHTLIFSINCVDIFEYMVYSYFYTLDDKLSSEKVKSICKKRIDFLLDHIKDKVDEQQSFTREEYADLRRLACKVQFLGLKDKHVMTEFKNILFVDKGVSNKKKRSYEESHSNGIFKQKSGNKSRKGKE